MANYDAQINILVSGQRNINNLANQLNQIESSITEIESRWRSASDAFQRSEIRLRAAGTRQPRSEGGRFARDPDRQARFRAYADRRRALVEQRLARISLSRTTAEAAASREQIDNNERILRQTEKRISFESRLNTANERYQYRLQKLRRGGGGRNLSQELQDQARSIQNAYNAAGGAASRNLRLIRSLSVELGVIVERQNEYNRLQALSSKGFEAGRRLQERITDIRNLGVQPEERIRSLRSQAAQVISASRSGDQQAYSEALRKATAATNRIERESREAAGRIAKFAQRSPVLGGVNFPGSPKALEAQRRLRSTLASGAIAEQSLINLQNKGVDVTEQLISLQKTLNDAKRDDFQISQRTLGNLEEQVTLAGKRVTLENRRLAGKGDGTGFSTALTPAESRKQIDQIYKDFNKAVTGNDSTSIGLQAKTKQAAQELVTSAQDIFPEFNKKFRKNASTLIPSAAATAAGKSVGEIGDYSRRIFGQYSGRRLTSAVGFQQGQRAPYVRQPGLGLDKFPSLEQEVAGKVRRLFERIGISIESIRIPSLGGFGGFGGRGGGGRGGGGGGGDASDGGRRRNRGWIDDLRDDIEEAFRGGDLPAITRTTNNQLEELAESLQRVRRTAGPATDAFRRANRGLRAVAVEQERRDPSADFLTRRLGARRGRAVGEGVIGGAFPLLFGQGLGASVGGGAGGFFGSLIGGNLGFGLSLLGTALGDVFDQLQVKAAAIGNALQSATSNMEALRESGISVTAELEAQVRLLNRYGASEAAQSAVEEAVFRQTGDIGGQGTRLAAGSANELQKAFEGMSAAAATAVGIIGAPFMQAITAAFRGVQAIFFAFNSIITAVTSIVNAIPGMEALGDALYEASIRGTAEYEKRQNELEKETENLGRLLQEQQKYNSELQAASGLKSNELKVAKMLIDYRQKERQSVEAILQKQEELGAGRTAEERKRIEEKLNTFRELEYEKLKQSALQNENEILDAQQDNVKRIQEFNESNAKSYRDMRLQIERQIEDERIAAARRIEDAELKGARAVLDFKEKGLQIIQNQRREQIELASAIRGLEAQFSANPSREGLAAQLSAAVDQYKNSLAEADENRKLAEEKIQLDAREAALAIERFKQDNARRVARINEESVRKIAEINEKIDKRRNESYKYAYDLTVQRLIAREQAAANQLEQQKAGNEALLSSPFITPDYKIAIEQEIGSIDAQLTAVQIGIQRLRRLESQLPATPQLQNVGSLPVMTSQASEVSAAETRVNSLIQAGKERLLQLEQQNTKESAAAELARQNLQIIGSQASAQTQITDSLNKRIEDAQRYKQLLASGINPELAKQVATIEGASARISDVIEMTIKQLEALDGSKFKELIETLRGIQQDQPTIVSEQIDKTKKALELEKPTLAEGISTEIDQLKKDLDPIALTTKTIVGGANAISGAFSQAFTDVISGAKSTEEALADTFESIGKAFLGMAAEIIAKQLTMITLQTILKALGAISSGFSFAGGSAEAGLDAANQMGGVGPLDAGMFGFRANGGPVNANQPYIVGERGPELFMPSSSGMVMSNENLQAQNRAFLDSIDTENGEAASGDSENELEATAATRAAIRENERKATIATQAAIRESESEATAATQAAIRENELKATVATRDAIRENERIQENRMQIMSQQKERYENERIQENRMQIMSQQKESDQRYENERIQENRIQIMSQQKESDRRYERERIEQMISTPGRLNIKYESQVINNVEYVSADQHRKGMAQAAERGRALTLQALQNSVKTRSRVGI